jgi:hypothetical protein
MKSGNNVIASALACCGPFFSLGAVQGANYEFDWPVYTRSL